MLSSACHNGKVGYLHFYPKSWNDQEIVQVFLDLKHQSAGQENKTTCNYVFFSGKRIIADLGRNFQT